MVDELVVGFYCKVFDHLVEVGRLDACDSLVSVDLVEGI